MLVKRIKILPQKITTQIILILAIDKTTKPRVLSLKED